jgi:PPOX class probable F420-dependent enzyme
VAPDVLAHGHDLALGCEQAGGMEAAGRLEGMLRGPELIRRAENHGAPDDGTIGNRVRSHGDLVERSLPADAARRRRDEVPLGHGRGIERPVELDDHRVVGRGELRWVAESDAANLGTFDQALRPKEPDRQLILVPGGAHRDGDGDRVLVGTRGPNLERLLGHNPIGAHLESGSAHGHDPGAGDVTRGWRRRVGHRRAVYAQRMPDRRLDDSALRLLGEARRAVLSTIDAHDGRPRSVPICFAAVQGRDGAVTLYSPLDEKPKSIADPRALGRVRNLQADPRATFLVDRWAENWSRLAWLQLDVDGRLVEPGEEGHAAAVQALRARYPQYRDQDLEGRPMLRLEVVSAVAWSAANAESGAG